ncbi:MAG: hypothetical protein J3Q66DRAFT_443069 [Benniella sp.]|nr:MAG: hypothetical protein J3Q66DRAFT_443069 [Benniella sp.]
MRASSIALSSQDILHHILTLGSLSQADLFSCSLVNSEWAAATLILLWRYPQCHSLHSFRLLLDTLRHEVDLSGPIAFSAEPQISAGSIADTVVSTSIALRRSLTMREKPTLSRSATLLATPYRPYQRRKEYGIPFHGQRVYHRAQFIRRIDFGTLASVISMHHLEILARSSKIGFRSLDLQNIRLPFSVHLLSILMNSKSLRELTLSDIHIPLDAIVLLESCFSGLTELRLKSCPDSMGDPELTMILRHCSKLKVLEVHGESFTDDSLGWISKTCLGLESLMIGAPNMTDQVIEQIAIACTRLKSWRLENCVSLLDATIDILEQKYHGDQSMASPLCGQPMITHNSNGSSDDRTFSVPGQDVVRLTGTLADNATSTIYENSPSALPSQSTCSHLDLEPFGSSLSPYHAFDHCSKFISHRYASTLEYSTMATGRLTTLELRNCTGIRPQLISSFLRSQLGLEHLVLGGSSITDEALASLTLMPLTRLQSLGIIECDEISDDTMEMVMYNCEQITKLTIFGSQFTLRTFNSISLHLINLEELHLEHVRLILNESLQNILTKCSRLRVLKLWHCMHLTQELFTDDMTPCISLEELEYMDKFPRQPHISDGCGRQVRFLESLVIRFDRLKILRLAKLADVTGVQVNLVSFLSQLDQLERFTILQNPGLDRTDLRDLKTNLPKLTHIGVGVSDSLSEEELLKFAQAHHRPGVQMYKRMLESSSELEQFVS